MVLAHFSIEARSFPFTIAVEGCDLSLSIVSPLIFLFHTQLIDPDYSPYNLDISDDLRRGINHELDSSTVHYH